ncbi:MAG: DUF255 domain-containing protein [Phycisphaerales bacterium JB063]
MPQDQAKDHAHHPHHDALLNPDGSWKFTNRLIDETSPYLRQHAHNPVDWYPWGEEAFALAQQRGVPIFLSIGYSTCYWCHVMERQVFEAPAIAAQMNELYVCIKVDREERPDVDDIYMAATQLMTRRGGWPMSVFLTPPGASGEGTAGLKPFWCGTYLPPQPMQGVPSFPQVVEALSRAWHEQRSEVLEQAQRLAEGVVDQLSESAKPAAIDPRVIHQAAHAMVQTYDPEHGGFGGGPGAAPKFPQPAIPAFLLALQVDSGNEALWQKIEYTLDRMARGGMYDQVGGGFHRYSVDTQWLVPHFEKMLYDNGQLAELYANAYESHPGSEHRNTFGWIAKGICDYILREMTDPAGMFWSAQDAEVDAQEGLNYLWTPAQVRAALDSDQSDRAMRLYGLDHGPNFQDPHAPDAEPKNVLYLPTPLAKLATELGLPVDALREQRDAINAALLEVRGQRDQPGTDDKVLTAWNGMMIAGLATVGGALDEPRFLAAASRAADAVAKHLAIPQDENNPPLPGGLYRTYRDGVAKIPGFLEDYAHYVHGLIQLHRHSEQSNHYLDWAQHYTAFAVEHFAHEQGGYYDTLADQGDLFVRTRNTYDGAVPSGNSQMIHNLVDLFELTGNRDFAQRAARDLRSFAGPMQGRGGAMVHMLHAMHRLILAAPGLLDTEDQSLAEVGAVQFTIAPETLTLQDGKGSLTATLLIAEDYHISAGGAGGEAVQATSLSAVANDPITLRIHWPDGEHKTYPFADTAMEVYEGEVQVRVEITIEGDAPDTLTLQLGYQACTDQHCEQPATQSVEITLR